jgi:hypothetical protein
MKYLNIKSIVFLENFFIYIEYNKYICMTQYSIFKFKYSISTILNTCLIFKSIVLSDSQYLNLIHLFKNIIIGYKEKFKIFGKGYNHYKVANFLLLKLGYPIFLCLFLPLNVKVWIKLKSKTHTYSLKHKKKNYLSLISIGLELREIKTLFYQFNSLRIPDVFCKQGIFRRGKLIKFKEGKKEFKL